MYDFSFVIIDVIDDDDIGISRTKFNIDIMNMEGRDQLEI